NCNDEKKASPGHGLRNKFKVQRTGKCELRTENLELRTLHPEPRSGYFKCLFTSFVISNMLTVPLPPNTGFSASSALIMRRFFASCSLFFLMYAHSFLVTSVRGSGLDPTTSPSAALGCIGFMN